MIPYSNFTWFGLMLYPGAATLMLGLTSRLSWRWTLLWTVTILLVQYSGSVGIIPGMAVRESFIVAGFAIYEMLIALRFLRIQGRSKDRRLFYVALFLALLPLLAAKFLPVLAPGTQFGFLGISYITFRALDVIICVNDGVIKNLPIAQLFTYLFFFPVISSGPIDRYRRFETDWKRERTREDFLNDLDGAAHRILTGFLYKFILAALIKTYWLDPSSAGSGFWAAASYMYAYSFYLFFDFAGYCLFAIGLSYLFGIHTPENFVRPFLATDIRDFWNRWNITLSYWFRDHVYMRFMLAASRKRWFKNKHVASALGLFLSFGLMGLWHGTDLCYILYGLYQASLFVAYDSFSRWNRTHQRWGTGPMWRAAGILFTFNAVCFGFLIFSGRLTTKTDKATGTAMEQSSQVLPGNN